MKAARCSGGVGGRLRLAVNVWAVVMVTRVAHLSPRVRACVRGCGCESAQVASSARSDTVHFDLSTLLNMQPVYRCGFTSPRNFCVQVFCIGIIFVLYVLRIILLLRIIFV